MADFSDRPPKILATIPSIQLTPQEVANQVFSDGDTTDTDEDIQKHDSARCKIISPEGLHTWVSRNVQNRPAAVAAFLKAMQKVCPPPLVLKKLAQLPSCWRTLGDVARLYMVLHRTLESQSKWAIVYWLIKLGEHRLGWKHQSRTNQRVYMRVVVDLMARLLSVSAQAIAFSPPETTK